MKVSWLVVEWLREKKMRPSVSSAVIMLNEGATGLKGTEPDEPGGNHALLVKSVSLSHVSSTLMTRFLCSWTYNMTSAYCYRSTRHRSELAWVGIFCAFRKLKPMSSLIMLRISDWDTSRPIFSLVSILTSSQLQMDFFSMNI